MRWLAARQPSFLAGSFRQTARCRVSGMSPWRQMPYPLAGKSRYELLWPVPYGVHLSDNVYQYKLYLWLGK